MDFPDRIQLGSTDSKSFKSGIGGSTIIVVSHMTLLILKASVSNTVLSRLAAFNAAALVGN
jgi:hypothetical protein